MAKVKYIKGKDGTVGAPAPSRGKGIHAAALEWIRDHPGEFKLYAGKWAAVSGNGVFMVGDSAEDIWEKIRKDKEAPQNPLVMFIPGLNEA